ncbi:MAG TPA: hypothetical protein VM734_11470 [Kofleriaceae bacterium]|nr:hypothetical protein [Kofleriaceae bacterium]
MKMSSHARLAAGLAAITAAAACGSQASQQPDIQTLDRPADVAFACYGRMRLPLSNGQPGAQFDDELDFSPQPLESCRYRVYPDAGDSDNAPPDQENFEGQPDLGAGLSWMGFVLQPVAGTVAVIKAEVKTDKDRDGLIDGYDPGQIAVQDHDPLTPGMNALSVGSQPIAIATAPTGCHVVTANAGSCDLSVIDVDRVIERPEGLPLVRRQAITTASGAPLLARPAAMVYEQSDRAIGVACPAEPDGLLYVAYPDCHAVGVIDSATGAAVASIRFAADGTATIGDGELACPAQCGTRMPLTDGARPVTLDLVRDDAAGLRRLAIGLENVPVVTVVDLDPTWRPTAVEQVELEGDVGVIDIAISPRLGMGGTLRFDEMEFTSPAEFVYAVTTDGTVRVAEVGIQDLECDTQVDPRFLRDDGDLSALICVPVVRPPGLPRRALARGPGIQLPGDDFALQVTISAARSPKVYDAGIARALQPRGHFAFVAGSTGSVYLVNIDDDLYADGYDNRHPLTTQLPMLMPHQLRDGGRSRGALSEIIPAQNEDNQDPPACDANGPAKNGDFFPGSPHVSAPPSAGLLASQLTSEKSFMTPYIRQLRCSRDDVERAVSELGWSVPAEVRNDAFPDLAAAPAAENWSITWEGSLSLDTGDTAVDGPAVRAARLTVGGGAMNVIDPSRPFCAAGVQPYDFVQLRGCDPARGSAQCSLGEVCYVHPESTLGAGICLPKENADTLGGVCRDFINSFRRYAVQESTAGQLVLSERRRVLRTTPVTGCTSAVQCDELEAYEASLTATGHPKDLPADLNDLIPEGENRTWACEPDPTRDGSINRCVMTCTENSQCEAGTVCSGGYCIEGPLPPPVCIAGLQRYELRATDAFVVVGNHTGYLHPVVEETATGRCVVDATANPLLVGRIPLTAPPCTGTDVTDVTPNPCRTTVEHAVVTPNYTDVATCKRGDTAPDPDIPEFVIKPTTVEAIRFSNPVFTTHLTDPTYPGDQRCNLDRLGNRTGIPVVWPGFAVSFTVVGGFVAQTAGSSAVFPANLVRTPDGAVWTVDEGDILPSNQVNARGQIIRFDPNVPGASAVVR